MNVLEFCFAYTLPLQSSLVAHMVKNPLLRRGRDLGSVRGLRRSPEEGTSPPRSSCLRSLYGQRSLVATDTTERLKYSTASSIYAYMFTHMLNLMCVCVFIQIIGWLNNLEIFRNFQISYVTLNLLSLNSQVSILFYKCVNSHGSFKV